MKNRIIYLIIACLIVCPLLVPISHSIINTNAVFDTELVANASFTVSVCIAYSVKSALDILVDQGTTSAPLKDKETKSNKKAATDMASSSYSISRPLSLGISMNLSNWILSSTSQSAVLHGANRASPVQRSDLWLHLLIIMLFCLLPRGAIDASSIIMSQYRYV